ncbi:uncharacterized protein LAESUDRAFT_718089 [Laetiporus sulphureus 93-53]|uniref:Uncharacterized protein n=1 Tax=Laetiporus sulphureus 93-53 TaxID=1314785 RepID=A0A165B9C8_9APHY|nr:uncharacterized protein LAESUDRAFT_718089 [Laetiporus sulphureus 93-53]KZT00546.1 hypothetical protein LAESUDRAFT_718089 [Laetiporus sulphureus 93-53]
MALGALHHSLVTIAQNGDYQLRDAAANVVQEYTSSQVERHSSGPAFLSGQDPFLSGNDATRSGGASLNKTAVRAGSSTTASVSAPANPTVKSATASAFPSPTIAASGPSTVTPIASAQPRGSSVTVNKITRKARATAEKNKDVVEANRMDTN